MNRPQTRSGNLSYITSRIINSRYPHAGLVYLFIPLILSSFTHLWNPLGFPAIFVDEGHYMRRALQVLSGFGPQESPEDYEFPYDHPYFGQIFLASLLKIVGYPSSTYSSSALHTYEGTVSAIESLQEVPRILVGLLAVVDTFLIYKIAEKRYDKKTAFIASIIFAVMPITWNLRMIVLESLLLPFLLSSLLFAVYSTMGRKSKYSNDIKIENKIRDNRKAIVLVLISGIFLGLSIFTKVPVVFIIPAIGFIVYTNTKNLKLLSLWIIPVITIPLIWPVYAISVNEFNSWVDGVINQTERKDTTIVDFVKRILNIDPVFLLLGLVAIVFAGIKRDYLFLLWTIPYLIFIAFFGATTRHFHFIVLTPILSIASAKLIIYLSDKISSYLSHQYPHRIQKLSLCLIVSGIVIFGLLSTFSLITINLNSTYFELYASIVEILPQTSEEENNVKKVTLLGNDNIRNYIWIPKYVLGKDHYSKDADPNRFSKESIKTDKILLIVDRLLARDILGDKKGASLEQIRSIYGDSHTLVEFGQTWPYDRDAYPYTSLKENFGIGSSVLLMTNY